VTDRLSGINLPTHGPYSDYNAALGECYPDIMWGDLGGAEAMWDAGKLPFIHYMFKTGTEEATIQNIAAGMFDEQIEAALRNLKAACDAGMKAVLVPYPEMNGNWCVYATDDYSTSDFIVAWYNFVHIADDIGLDESMVKFCWAPNDTGWKTLADWYPGDGYVDIVGASAYNWGGIFPNEPWESFAELADRFVNEVRPFTDKPIVITQTGALNGTGQKEWLDGMVQYVNDYTNISGVIYYDEMMFALDEDCDWNEQTAILNNTRPDHWFEEDTMAQHTSMLWLPDALRGAGINVIELDGWDEAQGNYYWTDLPGGHQGYGEEPTCYMIHHTASSSAHPEVKNSSGTWSKANCWAGLWRDGRLYQSGSGTPTIIFTSAGPARISSGYGHGPTLHQVADDIRVPWDQPNSDTDMAANRYAWNVETTHEGTGGPIDPGVEHALVVMGALMCDRFDWAPWRTIGHLTWTKRKQDPYWDNRRDIIVHIQDAVAEMMGDVPVGPEEPMENQGRNILYVEQGMSGMAVEYAQVQIVMAVKGIRYYGNSNKAFVEAEAPELTFLEWNQALTDYFSAWTGRRSYGMGPTEQVMVDEAIKEL